MNLEIALWMVVVAVLTVVVARKLRLSQRYERAPREKTPWQKLDHGLDPSVDE